MPAYLETDGVAGPRPAFCYKLFGLHVQSDVQLTELVEADDEEEADVTIRLSDFQPLEGERHDGFAVTADGAVLNVPKAGRYLIRDGREILVAPDPDGSERHLRLFLLGSAFGALLHQRGLLPLHANSIEIAGRAVAFLGHSGAGKSTMAAWFHDQGFQVLADDVCVVTFEGEEGPIAQPGIPRLRMWRDALEASGRSPEAYDLSFDDAEKYNVPTRAEAAVRPLQLGAIYLLRIAEEGVEGVRIEPLRGVEALDALVANTYRGGYLPMLEGTERHLAACLALVRSVPIFAVHRIWGKDRFGEQLAAIEQHARAVVTGAT